MFKVISYFSVIQNIGDTSRRNVIFQFHGILEIDIACFELRLYDYP